MVPLPSKDTEQMVFFTSLGLGFVWSSRTSVGTAAEKIVRECMVNVCSPPYEINGCFTWTWWFPCSASRFFEACDFSCWLQTRKFLAAICISGNTLYLCTTTELIRLIFSWSWQVVNNEVAFGLRHKHTWLSFKKMKHTVDGRNHKQPPGIHKTM